MFESQIAFTKEQYDKYYNERFIYGKELSNIIEIMETHDSYKILVLGAPGSGKSTLLNLLSHHTASKNPIEIIKGYTIYNTNFDLLNHKSIPCPSPCFVDGLDEMQNPYGLLHFLNKKKCDRLVCTSRPNLLLGEYFTHVVTLDPLTHEQIAQLIRKLGLHDQVFHSIISRHMGNMEFTPKDVLSHILADIKSSDIQQFYSKYSNFLYQYGNGVDFSSNIICPQNKVIVPPKEIIRDVTVVDNSLLRKVKENPKILFNFSPREFEEMVCELLDKQGYNVKLTKQTRDGGKDIIVVKKSILGEFCIYVECKRYDTSRPISVSLVRELYGTIMGDNVTAGMIVTTSYFTKDAKEYTEQIKHRMALKDYNDLVQELNNVIY